LQSWDNLWALLSLITARKCGRWVELFHARQRDVRHEQPASTGATGFEALASDPTPSEAAIFAETVEQLLAGLSERHRAIVGLSLQGYTPQEIGEQVGRSERTVNRVLNAVCKKLQRDCDITAA
jgi:RNA polymerase sigma-70 factor (ECF subfamily)